MKLLNILNRALAPAPWEEGDNIPWDDPEYAIDPDDPRSREQRSPKCEKTSSRGSV